MTLVHKLKHLAEFAREEAAATRNGIERAFFMGKAAAFESAADILIINEAERGKDAS